MHVGLAQDPARFHFDTNRQACAKLFTYAGKPFPEHFPDRPDFRASWDALGLADWTRLPPPIELLEPHADGKKHSTVGMITYLTTKIFCQLPPVPTGKMAHEQLRISVAAVRATIQDEVAIFAETRPESYAKVRAAVFGYEAPVLMTDQSETVLLLYRKALTAIYPNGSVKFFALPSPSELAEALSADESLWQPKEGAVPVLRSNKGLGYVSSCAEGVAFLRSPDALLRDHDQAHGVHFILEGIVVPLAYLESRGTFQLSDSKPTGARF